MLSEGAAIIGNRGKIEVIIGHLYHITTISLLCPDNFNRRGKRGGGEVKEWLGFIDFENVIDMRDHCKKCLIV